MFSIIKRIIAVLLLSVLAATSLYAQSDKNIIKRLPQIDLQRWHFGFILGLNFADFGVSPTGWTDEDGLTWYGESGGLSPAFNVGMIVDLRLVEYLNLRCTPTLTIGQRHLQYAAFNAAGNPTGEIISTACSPTQIEIPFWLKYSAKRYGNVRPYVLVGGGPVFNLNRDPEVPVLLKTFDVEVGFGIGMTIYTEYFRFCPELKFCVGLLDELDRNHPQMEGTRDILCTNAVERLTSRAICLTFNFE